MFKALTLTVLALATVSGSDRFLQASVSSAISTTCSQSKTAETCTLSGYCCSSISKNGAAVISATVGVCVPAEFSGVTFTASNVSSTTFNCSYSVSAANAV